MRQVSLTIRNIPLSILKQLKAKAAQNHRSMQGEILAILEQATLSPQQKSLSEVFANIKAIGLTSPAESTAFVRAAREKR